MRIKKHTSKNEYIRTQDNFWVRNLCKEKVKPLDINAYHDNKKVLLKNEFENEKAKIPSLEGTHIKYSNIVIVSDGLEFETRHKLLSDMPSAAILGINGSLSKWTLFGPSCPKEKQRSMFYVVNNPNNDCLSYLPQHDFYPTCMTSVRTNSIFIEKYSSKMPNNVFKYVPTPEAEFSGIAAQESDYFIDDYRNVVCAAIGLAHRFGVKKLMLMCCDGAFKDERPGSISTGKGTYVYPPQVIADNLIDANLFWLKNQNEKIEIADYSLGSQYRYATYIQSEQDAINFFKLEDE